MKKRNFFIKKKFLQRAQFKTCSSYLIDSSTPRLWWRAVRTMSWSYVEFFILRFESFFVFLQQNGTV